MRTWALAEDVVHLNHGSYGAVPVPAQAEQRRLRELMERDPDRWFRDLPERVAHARAAIARHCGADPDATALVPNASAGVTVVLNGLEALPGKRIVYTDHGYGAVELAIGRTCRRLGLHPHRVHVPLAADADTVTALITEAATADTALLVVDQVTSPTARHFPVHRIADRCRELGVPLLVDGAHAPGLVDDPVAGDFWVGNLHKWTCAPRNTAALVVAEPWRDRMRPLIASWAEEEPFPQRFDVQGTVDLTAWLAAPTAFAALRELGEHRHTDLVEYGRALLADTLDAPPLDVADPAPTMRLVPLPPGIATDAESCAALQRRIATEAACEVAITHWRGQGFLRLSAFAYNEKRDYHVLAERAGPLRGS